jgi:translation initiation factor 1 (eIF-1/SUI1)
MSLLVEQYEKEGGKILSKLEQRHKNKRVAVVDELDKKRVEMVSIYSEAKELVMDTVQDITENSTAQFEREWRKRQEAIQGDISDGRKVSEI